MTSAIDNFKRGMVNVLRTHIQAKEHMKQRETPTVPKRIRKFVPSLNEKAIRNREKVPLRLSVYVKESEYRRQQKLPPLSIHRPNRSGEVMTMYVLGDPGPAHDPLIRVETLIERKRQETRDSMVARDERSRQSYGNNLKLNKKKENQESENTVSDYYDLSPVPRQRALKVTTPRAKDLSYCFREIHAQRNTPQNSRKWVSERIKLYSDERVKKDFSPGVSLKKQLEITLRGIKEEDFRKTRVHRVRLDQL